MIFRVLQSVFHCLTFKLHKFYTFIVIQEQDVWLKINWNFFENRSEVLQNV